MSRFCSTLHSVTSLGDSLQRANLTPHIWFLVKVPVLSEHMTVVHPRVSTEGNLRTIAFYLAIFLVPRAKQVVMTVGSPSGIAATAKAIAILK